MGPLFRQPGLAYRPRLLAAARATASRTFRVFPFPPCPSSFPYPPSSLLPSCTQACGVGTHVEWSPHFCQEHSIASDITISAARTARVYCGYKSVNVSCVLYSSSLKAKLHESSSLHDGILLVLFFLWCSAVQQCSDYSNVAVQTLFSYANSL